MPLLAVCESTGCPSSSARVASSSLQSTTRTAVGLRDLVGVQPPTQLQQRSRLRLNSSAPSTSSASACARREQTYSPSTATTTKVRVASLTVQKKASARAELNYGNVNGGSEMAAQEGALPRLKRDSPVTRTVQENCQSRGSSKSKQVDVDEDDDSSHVRGRRPAAAVRTHAGRS